MWAGGTATHHLHQQGCLHRRPQLMHELMLGYIRKLRSYAYTGVSVTGTVRARGKWLDNDNGHSTSLSAQITDRIIVDRIGRSPALPCYCRAVPYRFWSPVRLTNWIRLDTTGTHTVLRIQYRDQSVYVQSRLRSTYSCLARRRHGR